MAPTPSLEVVQASMTDSPRCLAGMVAPLALDGRSTAAACRPMSIRSSFRSSSPATSWSWTVSAAARARPACRHRGRRREPAALQSRHQPDRKRLRQAQGAAPPSRGTIHQRPLERDRPHCHSHHPCGVRERLHRRWIRTGLRRTRSSKMSAVGGATAATGGRRQGGSGLSCV